MQRFFLIMATVFMVLMTNSAFAASAIMPVKAKIVNLTQLPVEEAIAFCDERNLACPAIRAKYDAGAPLPAVAGQSAGDYDKLRKNESGYYIE